MQEFHKVNNVVYMKEVTLPPLLIMWDVSTGNKHLNESESFEDNKQTGLL